MKLMMLLFSAAVLILDSSCAAESVRSAVELCIKTLIPGLFPLLIVSSAAVPYIAGLKLPWLSKLLNLPNGAEGLYILGALGGFPVGALSISQAVEGKTLSETDAERMLGLCSNCGPGFLFGVTAFVLSLPEAVLIFVLQLLSSILVGLWWPGKAQSCAVRPSEALTITEAVQRGIRSMATICAWVILAAVVTGFCKKWAFPLLDPSVQVMLTGFLELTGGMMALAALPEAVRLPVGTLLVCFGGVSVLLQIHGVTSGSGLRMWQCVMQKCLQALVGLCLCSIGLRFGWAVVLVLFLLCIAAKIAVEISGAVLYNTRRKEGI